MRYMELLSTGFERLDRALGGGLLPDSTTLIVHETYSWGWVLGFAILKNRITAGDFGVVMNSVLPLSSLEMELKPVGLDVENLGRAGKLTVIDVFSSLLGIMYPQDFVYSLDNLSAETFVPKYEMLYRSVLKSRIGNRRPVGLDFTLDGIAFIIGEDSTIRVFQRFMALKENSRLRENRKRPVNILVVNKDRVSQRFLSWFSLYSQYVLEIQSGNGAVEKILVRKSPLVYTPRGRELKLKRKRGRIAVE
ncbi:hypothetical protein [Thermococcus sp.]|uniref:hypothetical protein n=1 Tax=Thermococcus sp. TaxID=35749 RepID=UPI002627345C|nr:hypothetical protein [Thermococcus sp.]